MTYRNADKVHYVNSGKRSQVGILAGQKRRIAVVLLGVILAGANLGSGLAEIAFGTLWAGLILVCVGFAGSVLFAFWALTLVRSTQEDGSRE